MKPKIKLLLFPLYLLSITYNQASVNYENMDGSIEVEPISAENSFFSLNKTLPFSFGLQLSVELYWKFPQQAQRKVVGEEGGKTLGVLSNYGLFAEWQPLNGVGFRSGLYYTWGVFGIYDVIIRIRPEKGDKTGGIKYTSFNIPLLLRVYPAPERKFALYVGPIFSFARKFESLNFDQKYLEESSKAIAKMLDKETKDYSLCAGLDYTSNSGFLIGLHSINFKSLGLDLGWDFSKLFK